VSPIIICGSLCTSCSSCPFNLQRSAARKADLKSFTGCEKMSERKDAGLNSLGICTDVFTLQPRPALGFGRMFCNIQKIAFKTIHIARLPSREDSASKRDDRTTYDMAHRAAMHRPPAAPLSRAISRRSPPSKAHEKEQSNRRLRNPKDAVAAGTGTHQMTVASSSMVRGCLHKHSSLSSLSSLSFDRCLWIRNNLRSDPCVIIRSFASL